MHLTITATAALMVLATACSSSTDTGDSGGSDTTSKYAQTWPKSYSATTSREWNRKMTKAQKRADAADMLTGARNEGDGGNGLPPDSLIDEFQDGVTTACVVPSMSLTDVGAGLYLTERARFQP
jgi:hypothetical protein